MPRCTSSDAVVSKRVFEEVSASWSGSVASATSTRTIRRYHSRVRSAAGTISLNTTPEANGTASPEMASTVAQPV